MSGNPQLDTDAYMSVRQVAQYLQLNEKKVYALVNEGRIPATKVTGKWMFPKELVDRWMLDSSHGGLLTDRLLITGGDDPLLYRTVMEFAQDTGARALISYAPTGTRLGLELLQANRVDASIVHWGPHQESRMRHPALLSQYRHFRQWVLIRAFRREQGLMLGRGAAGDRTPQLPETFRQRLRWVLLHSGTGTQRYLLEILSRHGLIASDLQAPTTALSEREAAAAIAAGQADAAPGTRAFAAEFGLHFLPTGWESFDLALPRGIWFRHLFQELINRLKSEPCQQLAERLTGYDLSDAGELVWGDE